MSISRGIHIAARLLRGRAGALVWDKSKTEELSQSEEAVIEELMDVADVLDEWSKRPDEDWWQHEEDTDSVYSKVALLMVGFGIGFIVSGLPFWLGV